VYVVGTTTTYVGGTVIGTYVIGINTLVVDLMKMTVVTVDGTYSIGTTTTVVVGKTYVGGKFVGNGAGVT
jgi:hypothetical protein